jgi:hypothetical protein
MKLLPFLILCFTTVGMADDFKTVQGKEYKNVTVSRVEPDGIVLKSKSGISKVYFVELPKDVQDRFHYNAAIASAYSAQQTVNQATTAAGRRGEPISVISHGCAGGHQSTLGLWPCDHRRFLRGLVRPVPTAFTESRGDGEKRS